MRKTASERAASLLARYDRKPYYRSPDELAAAAAALADALHELLYVLGETTVQPARSPLRRPKFFNGQVVSNHRYRVPHTHACAGCAASLDCDLRFDDCARRRWACSSCIADGRVRGRTYQLARTR